MEIGVDSFASAMYGTNEKNALNPVDAMEQLLERIELADQAGLDVFGIGEHHKKGFLDSATVVILAAAAARTKRMRLASAVMVFVMGLMHMETLLPQLVGNEEWADLVASRIALLLSARSSSEAKPPYRPQRQQCSEDASDIRQSQEHPVDEGQSHKG